MTEGFGGSFSGADHPNGFDYETQQDRFGSGGLRPIEQKPLAKVQVERSFRFGIPEVKSLIVEYLQVAHGINITVDDVQESISGGYFFNQFDHQAANAVFTATVKE